MNSELSQDPDATPRISPREPPSVTEAEKLKARHAYNKWGCAWLSFGLFFLFAYIADGIQQQFFPELARAATDGDDSWVVLGLLGCVVTAIVPSLLILSGTAKARTRRNLEKIQEERKRKSRDEALKSTGRATSLMKEGPQLADRLPLLAAKTRGFLVQAARDFADSAFSPFWDSMVQAADSLDAIHQTIRRLRDDALSYDTLLSEREHSFPPYPVCLSGLPDITPLEEDYGRLLRQGQSNKEFAMILEQRRTRQAMLQEQQKTREAVKRFTDAIDSVAIDLQESRGEIRSEMERLVDAQTSSRDTITTELERLSEKLDRIKRETR